MSVCLRHLRPRPLKETGSAMSGLQRFCSSVGQEEEQGGGQEEEQQQEEEEEVLGRLIL